jgi:hypothetical protein
LSVAGLTEVLLKPELDASREATIALAVIVTSEVVAEPGQNVIPRPQRGWPHMWDAHDQTTTKRQGKSVVAWRAAVARAGFAICQG